MAALNYFHLTWDDVETFDGLPVSGAVKIRPYLSDVVSANDDANTTLSPKPIPATLVDGVLKDEAGNSFVNLVCDQASLTLTEPLMYQVSFSRMKDSGGKSAPGFRTFVFAAPTSTSDFNLAEAVPIPGALPGVGSNFVEWSEVTEKPPFLAAGTTAQEARDAIGVINGGDMSTKLDKVVGNSVVYVNDNSGAPNAVGYNTAPSSNSLPRWDGNGQLRSNIYTTTTSTVATNGGTTTLNVGSNGVQIFTGTQTQTVVLPTTSVLAGASWTIFSSSTQSVVVQSSAGNAIATLTSGQGVQVVALTATPTLSTHWATFAQSPYVARTTGTSGTLVIRDSQANVSADAFIPGASSVGTSAGTSVQTIDSNEVIIYTGTTTHTHQLATTSIPAGYRQTVINQSTGIVTVNASAGGAVVALGAGVTGIFTSAQAAPTLPAHWAVNTGTAANISTGNAANSLVQRTSIGAINATNVVTLIASTVTSGITTTLTNASAGIQEFTGTANQTISLPTTSISAGWQFTVICNTTGTLQVNSSGGNSVAAVNGNARVATFTALVATPTTAAHWTVGAGLSTGVAQSAGAFSVAMRNGDGNLFAANFIPSVSNVVGSSTPITLLSGSPSTQIVTGSVAQTYTLPTTTVPAGLSYLFICDGTNAVTVNASNGSPVAIFGGAPRNALLVVAKVATPTSPADWVKYSYDDLTRTTAANANTVPVRDANSRLLAAGFIPTIISTATSGGSNTVGGSGGAAQTQVFTGTTTHTGLMASTGIIAGQVFTVLNQSTGAVTINSSAGNLIKVLPGGTSTELTALQATPTAANHWFATSSSGTVTNRVVTVTAGATPTSNTDVADVLLITGLTVDITNMSTNMTGTPNPEDALRFAITGTASRAITWGTKFESGGATLPTTTTGTQRLDVGFFWNSATSKWRCMAVASA